MAHSKLYRCWACDCHIDLEYLSPRQREMSTQGIYYECYQCYLELEKLLLSARTKSTSSTSFRTEKPVRK